MDESTVFADEDPGLAEVLAEIRDGRGIDFSGYRQGTVLRRVLTRLDQLGIPTLTEYLERLRSDPGEQDALIDAIAVNVSCFFRDPVVFEILEQSVVPAIVAAKRKAGREEVRIWSAGCASGEEAYSAAIVVARVLGAELPQWSVLVLATDIDRQALATAERAVYPGDQVLNAKLGVLETCFERRGKGYAVLPFIRDTVRFSHHDLTSPATVTPPDSVFGDFDLVLCRNVLIYLTSEAHEVVCSKLDQAVVGGGYLVLGNAEDLSPGARARWRAVDARNRVYRRA